MKISLGTYLLSFFFLLNFIANVRSSHPTHKTNGDFTDHFSHANAGLLFLSQGFRLFSEKIETVCGLRESSEISQFIAKYKIADYDQKHVCQDHPGSDVLFINGSDGPRPYPLGALIYSSIGAAIYFFSKDFIAMNEWLIFQYFFMNLIFLLLIYKNRKRFLSGNEWDSIFYIPFFLLIAGLTYESSIGIYDGISIFFLCWSLLYVGGEFNRENGIMFFFFFSCSLFFNYRALYWSPLLAMEFINWIQKKGSMESLKKYWRLITFSFLISGLSLLTFFMSLGSIQNFSSKNPLNLNFYHAMEPMLLVSFVTVTILIYHRAWREFAVLLMALAFTYRMPFVRTWHLIYFFPILFLVLKRDKERRGLIMMFLLMFFIHIDWLVFRTGVFFSAPLSLHLLDIFR